MDSIEKQIAKTARDWTKIDEAIEELENQKRDIEVRLSSMENERSTFVQELVASTGNNIPKRIVRLKDGTLIIIMRDSVRRFPEVIQE